MHTYIIFIYITYTNDNEMKYRVQRNEHSFIYKRHEGKKKQVENRKKKTRNIHDIEWPKNIHFYIHVRLKPIKSNSRESLV
jgi:hypothetical protein